MVTGIQLHCSVLRMFSLNDPNSDLVKLCNYHQIISVIRAGKLKVIQYFPIIINNEYFTNYADQFFCPGTGCSKVISVLYHTLEHS